MTAAGDLAEGLIETCAGDLLSDGTLSDADSGVATDRGLGAGARMRDSYEFDAGPLFDSGGHHAPVAHPDNVAASAQQTIHFLWGTVIAVQ